MSKFIPNPLAAMMSMTGITQPGSTYGYDNGNTDVPTGLADSLAQGIDFSTPGVSLFAVAFGYAHQHLAERATADYATGKHTLH